MPTGGGGLCTTLGGCNDEPRAFVDELVGGDNGPSGGGAGTVDEEGALGKGDSQCGGDTCIIQERLGH